MGLDEIAQSVFSDKESKTKWSWMEDTIDACVEGNGDLKRFRLPEKLKLISDLIYANMFVRMANWYPEFFGKSGS